jgi:diketogulonate reductase-like aldo/keto reductase
MERSVERGLARSIGVSNFGAADLAAVMAPAQVLLRWCLQHEVLVIPKSVHQERIRENAQIFDFTLSPEDMAALDALDRTKGTDRAYERNVWRGALRRVRALIPRTSLLRPG